MCVWTVGANTKAHPTLMKNRPQDAPQTLKPGLAGENGIKTRFSTIQQHFKIQQRAENMEILAVSGDVGG